MAAAKKTSARGKAKRSPRKKKGTRGKGASVPARSEEEQTLDNAQVRGAVALHCSFLASRSADRKKINADVSASRNALVARGLNRAALNVVEKCAKMEPQHAEGFALTLVLGLKAIDQPLQGDLFREPAEEEKPKAAAREVPDDQVPAGSMH